MHKWVFMDTYKHKTQTSLLPVEIKAATMTANPEIYKV